MAFGPVIAKRGTTLKLMLSVGCLQSISGPLASRDGSYLQLVTA